MDKQDIKYLNIQDNSSELILDTPNRNEILKDGPPESSKFNILGRGSYGVVFKAIYKSKQVAVKIMKNKYNGRSDAISNEANIIGWRHRNIVQLLKIESTVNYGIVIMERFPGQCLQIILDSIDLPLEHRIYITLDVTNALIYCHNRKFLHLDVKPQNVLVAYSPSESTKRKNNYNRFLAYNNRAYICKLCDFGSSVSVTGDDTENIRRSVQGTVRYMSPEALREDRLSPAADIFSLGVTMWQLKSRQLPYSWIECNEIVAYQVVKNHLRPTGKPTESKSFILKLISNNSHKNCLCEQFSSEISHRSLDHIRTMLEKTKTVSPFKPKISTNHLRPEKLKNQISRNLIGTFQNTFAGFKKNLLVDEMSCETLEEQFKDEFPLTELFKKSSNLIVHMAENLYTELYMSCWHNDPVKRLNTSDVKQKIMNLFVHYGT